MEEGPKEPLLVRIKYYTTLTLGLTACLSCFIFFFLIPFILDPSVSTLVADFNPEPVVCKTILTEHLVGMKNCSWSSCKQGCTVDQYDCDRIFVNYMAKRYEDFDKEDEFYEDDDDIWVMKGVPIFVNIKGCGYPPHTNCTIYTDEYGPIGSYFPCYHSRARPSLVITDYSWESAVHPMIMALIIPNVITGLSLGILSYWWYPGCQKSENSYHIPPDQQSQQGEDEDNRSHTSERSSNSKTSGKSSGKSSIKDPPNETKIDLLGGDNTDCKAAMEPEKSV